MSAAEIIEQIKALSPEERQEVSRVLKEIEESVSQPSIESPRGAIRYATDEQARAAGDAVVAEYPETFRRLAE